MYVIDTVSMVIGAYAYYECDLYKRYEVYGALLLGVTAALQKSGYQEHGGKLHKYFVCVCVHVCVRMYVCLCVCMCMYVCVVCVCVCVCVHQ